ncbi:MAG: hypothetical protein KDB20_14260 [Microthrixaceae bacterium]|nr:hypothetical protein [Microthrixaceae bacterium]
MSEPPTNPADAEVSADDGIEAKRARIKALSAKANRYGYLAILLAMVVFVIGFFTSFSLWVTTTILVLLVLSGLLLVPAMIFGYGVKYAEQDERGEKFHY